jgi:hypothetical protein
MGQWEASIGASDEWFTPPYIFVALGETFDLDVAHPPYPMETHVPAKEFLSSRGLDAVWHGFIWMNPPFGPRGSLGPWLQRFFEHGHGIALTPDRTSAPWFRQSWHKAGMTLFMPKVRFIRPDGTEGKSPANGTCLWAAGARAETALERAAKAGLGILARPVATTYTKGAME